MFFVAVVVVFVGYGDLWGLRIFRKYEAEVIDNIAWRDVGVCSPPSSVAIMLKYEYGEQF